MSTISVFFGITIRMYAGDHAPPFHAYHGELEALVAIDTLEVREGRLPTVYWLSSSSLSTNRKIFGRCRPSGRAVRKWRPWRSTPIVEKPVDRAQFWGYLRQGSGFGRDPRGNQARAWD